MRILRLALQPYGLFREPAPLELMADKRLHIIFGPNETGKTTRRSAIADLLFGFRLRTKYDFAFDQKTLRICATISMDGATYDLERRKGNKDTLRFAGGDVFPAAVEKRWQGGADHASYCRLFAFGADELKSGAELLLESKGDLGYSLYGASLGGADARAISLDLTRTADQLFLPNGTRPPINHLIAQHLAKQKEVRELSFKPEAYLKSVADRDRIASQLLELDHEQGRQAQRAHRVDSLVSVIAQHEQYCQVTASIEAFVEKALVRDDLVDAVSDALSRLHATDDALQESVEDLEHIDSNPIVSDCSLLRVQLAVDALGADLGGVLAGTRAAEENDCAQNTRVHRARYEHLREKYWPGLDDAAALGRRPSTETFTRAQDLSARFNELDAAHRNASRGLAAALEALLQCETELRDVPELLDTTILVECTKHSKALGNIDQQIAESDTDVCELGKAANLRVQRLRFFNGTSSEFAVTKMPMVDEIERFEQSRSSRCSRQAILYNELKTLEKEARKAEKKLERLGAQLESADRMYDARSERDSLFATIETSWRDAEHYSAQPGAAYRARVQIADGVADERQTDAQEIAEAGLASSARDAAHEALAANRLENDSLLSEEAAEIDAWRLLWSSCGIDPGTPVEMQKWLSDAQSIRESFIASARVEADCAGQQARRSQLRLSLAAELNRLTGTVHPDDGMMLSILTRAEDVIARADEGRRVRTTLSEQRRAADIAVREAEQRQEEAHAYLEVWRSEWLSALESLALPSETAPSALTKILNELRELFVSLTTSAELQQQLNRVILAENAYRHRAKEVCLSVAPDLMAFLEESLESTVETLLSRLKTAREGEARAIERNEFLRKANEKRLLFEGKRDEDAAVRDALLKEAQATVEDVSARLEASLTLRSNVAQRCQLEETLCAAVRCSIEEINLEVDRVGYEGLRSEQFGLKRAVEDLAAKRDTLMREKFENEKYIDDVEASDAAAQAQGELMALRAEIDRNVKRYAAVVIARKLLDDEVTSFALAHQAPILEEASRYFRAITVGQYERVRVVAGEGDRGVIEVVQGNGSERRVEDLSDGTRDQLYLALRLAALSEHLQEIEPLPLLIDDVLQTFDDERTTEALETLEGFGQLTQVIYFTHHQNVVDLARDRLGDSVDIIQLDGLVPA